MSAAAARRRPEFWLLLSAVALGAGSLRAMLTHMVPLLTDRGIPVSTATMVFSITALSNATWQIGIGSMLDRARSPRFAGMFVMMTLIGLALIEFKFGTVWLVVAAILIGIGSGTEYGLLPCTISRYFGPTSFAEIYGMIFGVSMLVGGLAPLLTGIAYDLSGGYLLALAVIAAALFCSALLIAAMPSYHNPVPDPASPACEVPASFDGLTEP